MITNPIYCVSCENYYDSNWHTQCLCEEINEILKEEEI